MFGRGKPKGAALALTLTALVSGCESVPKGGAETALVCAGWKEITVAEDQIAGLPDDVAIQIAEHGAYGAKKGCW